MIIGDESPYLAPAFIAGLFVAGWITDREVDILAEVIPEDRRGVLCLFQLFYYRFYCHILALLPVGGGLLSTLLVYTRGVECPIGNFPDNGTNFSLDILS
jgi:hypothetical protein